MPGCSRRGSFWANISQPVVLSVHPWHCTYTQPSRSATQIPSVSSPSDTGVQPWLRRKPTTTCIHQRGEHGEPGGTSGWFQQYFFPPQQGRIPPGVPPSLALTRSPERPTHRPPLRRASSRRVSAQGFEALIAWPCLLSEKREAGAERAEPPCCGSRGRGSREEGRS